MFIKIKDRRIGDEPIINTENIAILWEDGACLVMCGTHGEGNGLIHTTEEDIRKILKYIEVVE